MRSSAVLLLALVVLLSLFSVAQSGACCGDSRCDWPAEDCRSCPTDCGACPTCNLCGNRVCDIAKGETPCNCPLDCGPCCPDGVCREDRNETAANCPSDCALNIRLLVIDEKTGAHLPGATVRCHYDYQSAVATYGPSLTNSDGRTSYSGVAGGNYLCTGELFAYFPGYVKFTVFPLTTPQEYIIPLRQNPACLEGTVYDAVTLEPLDNATVYCRNNDNSFTTRTVTASVMGYFYFEPVPPGSYRCFGSRINYFPNSNAGYVEAGKMATIDIYLNPLPGGIIGTVYNIANNTVIPGAQIVCTAESGQQLPTQTTNSNGFYYIPNVSATRVTCTASVVDFNSETKTGIVVNGKNTTINFYLGELPGSLQVTVVENGTTIPIPNAQVSCTASTQTLITPANGTVLYDPVSAGSYICYASATGFSANSVSGIIVIRNRRTFATIPLSPLPGLLTVITVDNSTKLLLPGATVSVTGQANYGGVTTGAGASISFTVPAGTYSASATASGYYPGFNNSFSVAKGQTVVVYIYLNPLPGQLIVTVIASDTNAPLVGAIVRVTGPSSQVIANNVAAPSPDARLSYTVFAYGYYTASASATGYSSDTKVSATPVLSNTTVTIQLVLTPLPNRLTVFVRDAQSFQLINGAQVTLAPANTQQTATTGSTVYSPLNAGTYTASATATGYNTNTSEAVTLTRNDDKNTTVWLSQLGCTLFVQVLNARTNAIITGANVSLNNAFYGSQLTNPTASFIIYTRNPVTNATATANGYRGSDSQMFTCTPGGTANVTLRLNPVVQVFLSPINSYQGQNTRITNAVIYMNGDTIITRQSNIPGQYVIEPESLNFTASFYITAPGFTDATRTITWTANGQERQVSLAPENFALFFLPYETYTNGSKIVVTGNILTNNLREFTGDLGAPITQFYYEPSVQTIGGSAVQFINGSTSETSQAFSQNNYDSEGYDLSDQAVFNTLLRDFLAGGNLPANAPVNRTLTTASFTNVGPSSEGIFFLLLRNITGLDMNWPSSIQSSLQIFVPDYPVTPIRHLLEPIPFRINTGFFDLKVVPYEADGTTISTFRTNNFVGVNFNTSSGLSYQAYAAGKLTGFRGAILEKALPFGTTVLNLPMTYQGEEFDESKSGFVSNGQVVVGRTNVIPGVTNFFFPPAALYSSLFTFENGQAKRNANARIFVLSEYRVVRLAGVKRREL